LPLNASRNASRVSGGCEASQAASDLGTRGVEVKLEKVEDMAAILGYGVMSTPGVVVDGKVVHAGGVPDRKKIDSWLA
jgi:predicted thioredoxin/glutaredoxin